jgi:hypothetical protein
MIRHYDGNTWSVQDSADNEVLVGVWGSSPTDVFVVGWRGSSRGIIRHYDGNTWSVQVAPPTNWLEGVWGSSATDVFAVGLDSLGSEGAILHYDGNTWSTQYP